MTHEQIIRAIEQMPAGELDSFVNEVLNLRARKRAHCLSQDETDLFHVINRGFSEEVNKRCQELIGKRDEHTITESELEELTGLLEELEDMDAARLEALVDLARLRNVSFDQIKRDLQLTSFHGK